jgi:RNA polymerase sigma-70 factor (ECF subfamily)
MSASQDNGSGAGRADPPDLTADGAARDELLDLYFQKRPNLVRFFAAKTGSHAAAEDLAQELYLKLRTRPGEPHLESPTALLYRIATNLLFDRTRGERRSASRDSAWREATTQSAGGEDLAREPLPEDAVASRERLRQLFQAAEELPPQMGRAFRLHKLQGLSHAETAQQMGLSKKAVEKHVSAALKALTRKLSL